MRMEPGAALRHCGSPECSEPAIWEPPKLRTNPTWHPNSGFQTQVGEVHILITFWTSSELVQWLDMEK